MTSPSVFISFKQDTCVESTVTIYNPLISCYETFAYFNVETTQSMERKKEEEILDHQDLDEDERDDMAFCTPSRPK